MNYYDMHKTLCKELKCEFEKFENDASDTTLHNIKELIESMVGLTELEAANVMRDYLEDEHGYDSRMGEFRADYMPKFYRNPAIYNGARYPIPIMTNNDIYNEYIPMDDMYMNRGGQGGRGGNGGRRGGNNRGQGGYNMGDYDMYNGYMNDGRGGNQGGYNNRNQSRDSRGRYNEGYSIYNMAHDAPKKLTEQEKQKWLDSMENSDGTRGEMFSKDECAAIAKKVGAKFDEYSESDFCVAVNAVYSDYYEALCKIDQKVADDPMTYGYLAMAWLDDADSYPPDERLARYWHYMVKHDKEKRDD